MRALPLTALLLLGACANVGGLGQANAPPSAAAVTALRDGSPQIAVQIDNAILVKDPHNLAALLNRGDAQTALQQPIAAAESYTYALLADPHSVSARIGLGRLRLANDPSAAESIFRDASQLDPHNATAWNDLGIARDLLGRHRDAQAAYREAIGLDASMRSAEVNLALSYALADRPGDAALLQPRLDQAAAHAIGDNRSVGPPALAQDLQPPAASAGSPLARLAAPTPLSLPGGATSAVARPVPPAATAAAASDASPAPRRVTDAAASPEPAAVTLPAPAAATAPAALAATRTRVELSATADAWMQVRDRSGRVLLSRILHPGDAWPVPARPNLVLTTGNAGGTDILVDGVAIPSLGASGAVRRDIPLDAGILEARVHPSVLRPIATASAGPPVTPLAAPSTPSPSDGAASVTERSAHPAATSASASGTVPTSRRAIDTAASPAPAPSAPPTQAAAATVVAQPQVVASATADATPPADRGLLAAGVSPGKRALTIGVDGVTGATGIIWPGDLVDLILTQDLQGAAASQDHRIAAATVLSKVRVIAIDDRLVQEASPTSAQKLARTVTFEVDRDQAKRVSVATRLGRLWLATRSGDAVRQAANPHPASPTVWASEAVTVPAQNPLSAANHIVRVFPGAADSKEFHF